MITPERVHEAARFILLLLLAGVVACFYILTVGASNADELNRLLPTSSLDPCSGSTPTACQQHVRGVAQKLYELDGRFSRGVMVPTGNSGWVFEGVRSRPIAGACDDDADCQEAAQQGCIDAVHEGTVTDYDSNMCSCMGTCSDGRGAIFFQLCPGVPCEPDGAVA